MRAALTALTALPFLLAACAGPSGPIEETYGPSPILPEPQRSLIPPIWVAPAVGWPAAAAPTPGAGLTVTRFADGLDHPRWLYVLPNGDVLVSEAATKPGRVTGLKSWLKNSIQKRAGSIEEDEQSPDRIVLLRDADGDGAAETREVFLDGLNQPFGMTMLGGDLYIGETDALVRVPYQEGDLRARGAPQHVVDLPYNADGNGHWTRNVVTSPDGNTLYVAVGSVSNVGEAGMAVEQDRAAIHTVDPDTGAMTLFAGGLRNPNGMAFEPVTLQLWTAVNERDEIGDNLVPDYMTSVQQGGFYGWPWSYFGQHLDPRFEPEEIPQERIASAIVPDYALGAHTASLGLAFNEGAALGAAYRGGAFVGQHGSWNRGEPSGYKVIYVPFAGGQPSGPPIDVLTGFINEDGEAMGRPVGVAIAADGALLVADDVGEMIWRVTAAN